MVWVRRILLGAALLLLIALVVAAGEWWQLRSTPEWYPTQMTAADRAAAAARAEKAWLNAQNRVAAAHATQMGRGERGGDDATTQAGIDRGEPIEVSFSADELNAFFHKWAAASGWDARIGAYLKDPQIVLHEGRLIVAGELKDLGMLSDTKASLHFAPRMTDDGRLDLQLVRIMGGRAPLPLSLWNSQKQKLQSVIERNLPPLQREARFAADGDANASAIKATMSLLLLHMLDNEPAEAVVYVPVSAGGVMNRQIPVRVRKISVEPEADGEPPRLTLGVAAMSPTEQQEFLSRLRTPYKPVVARAAQSNQNP